MKLLLTFLLLVGGVEAYSQTFIKGTVVNADGKAIYLATIQIKNNAKLSTFSDHDGRFTLQIADVQDTLVVSNVGYDSQEIAIASLTHLSNTIVLKIKSMTLEEVVVRGEDPISSRFSVTKIEKFDIYLNPISQGDPLKAITILPSSTTTDESALPSLRGSSSSRSSVRLNGVPLVNPVRSQSINSQGFFSLFNPEIIDKQYVYASNPPLIYGNASSGVVDIHTNRPPVMDQIQVSTSLANVAALVTQNIAKRKGLIQAYTNYQFSNFFKSIQKQSFSNLQDFSNVDAGISYSHKFGRRFELKSYNYFIREKFNGFYDEHAYQGKMNARSKRFFSVNSFNYYSTKGIFMFNTGYDMTRSKFSFGNIYSDNEEQNIFASLNYKKFIRQNLDVQVGVDLNYNKSTFKDSVPIFTYALSPSSPNMWAYSDLLNKNIEAYSFVNWKIKNNLSLYVGGRKNVAVDSQKNYISYQLGMNYKPSRFHSFIIGGGQYHNYSNPTMYMPSYHLMKSKQASLDYQFKKSDLLLKSAVYYKDETGDRQQNNLYEIFSNRLQTFGAEIYLEKVFYRYFKYSLSNSFIHQKSFIEGKRFHGPSHLKYFIKTFIEYNKPSLFSLSLVYLTRPGTFINTVERAEYYQDLNVYYPIYSTDYFNKQLPAYHRFDVSFSKFIRLKSLSVATFISLNNVFNNKNAMRPIYSPDYSSFHYDNYQYRTLYFGAVWYLKN